MPVFHCPMGAPYYESEGCIKCDLCMATTEEDMVKASRVIREYMKKHDERLAIFKKIAICGKGGTGKSTITTLLTSVLAEQGYSMLAIDTDESNPGLHKMFGFEKEPRPLISLLSRFSLNGPAPNTDWLAKDKITTQDIPAEFIMERANIKFMMVGKIENPFQGCACTMADITRDLMMKFVLGEKEKVVIDMEAGVESFGRGVERAMDTVIIVVEPSYESINLAGKIAFMADGIGATTVRAILNKVTSEDMDKKMQEQLRDKDVKTIGTVYLDPEISETNFLGKPLGASKARDSIKLIARGLLALTGEEIK